ncbi:CheR family methyltransferase [Geoalkalibacter halelectricus]|uniref:protein-glutamate O-methyltransferase n=1 Tax=Geoalkalibacter halelectricus TaxID=2847045 RepID=A0ABY5ZIU8_9BACT|nr:protein-glutamate O-methyltransferase [Geoalkalibacter halelectricus]MDO3377765.1 protein-glutamate O-methyltransferase [Geoalkalibacter halelectricus]UWZ78641.1 protein-glutamate O-methyltransferase [Geoalkalibacter halelectricus]
MALTDQDFKKLCAFIYEHVGIKMSDVKRTMLEGRLQKRLRVLGLADHRAYCEFLFSAAGQEQELVHMIDVVTTNKTDFFREPAHFNFLAREVLPQLAAQYGRGNGRKIRFWSAGCSTGEEPYTLAMVLREFQEERAQERVDFDIFASDISTRVLEHARRAVYSEERIGPVPPLLRKKYLLRSRDPKSGLVRMGPALRAMLRFGRINFMDEDFGLQERFQVVFCRNVIIYFDKPTQERLMHKFCRHLDRGGYLFLGHSESLHGFDVPLTQVAPTVYRRQ